MVFHWSLSNSKSPQVSRTLLSIRSDVNNAVIWMSLIRPLVFKSSRSLTKRISYIWYQRHFHVPLLYFSLARFKYLSLCFLWFLICGPLTRQGALFDKFTCFFLFSFIITWSSLLARIRWSACISKSLWFLCIFYSRTDSGLYHLVIW